MTRIRNIALSIAVGLLAFSSQAGEIRVWAAASLMDALKSAAAGYEKESGDHIVFNFAGSSLLARQIIEGAPADLFFSADQEWMDTLQSKGLIAEGTRRAPLGNTLVIVVGRESGANLGSPADLLSPKVQRLALADPQAVPAGRYAAEWLKRLGLWGKLQTKVVSAGNVRGALAAVESGNAEAAIVYKTDALVSKKVRVAVEVSRAEGPDIRYALAVLNEAPHAESALKFLEFLVAPKTAAIFEEFGFLVLHDPKPGALAHPTK